MLNQFGRIGVLLGTLMLVLAANAQPPSQAALADNWKAFDEAPMEIVGRTTKTEV